MALLSLTGAVTLKDLKPFAGDEDRNFEGHSSLDVTLTATPAGTAPVTINEGLEWWCGEGGWVTFLFQQAAGNAWGFGAAIPVAGASRTWTQSSYPPLEHVVFMARAANPAGGADEWAVAQAPVAFDASTRFTGTIERRPDLGSPPQLPLPIGHPSDAPDVKDPVFLAVRGPVEAYDLILPAGGGLVRRRTLIVAGQIVNWFKTKAVADAISNPGALTGPVNLKISVEDHTGGRMVVADDYFNAASRTWDRNLGKGDNAGFTLQHDDRVAAFMVHIPVPETFSFGTLILEFVWPDGVVKRSIPVRAGDPDVLHLPVQLDPGQTLHFGNGPSPNFNGHTGADDQHQHLSYDIIVNNADGSSASFGTPLTAVATGIVRGRHDTEADHPVGTGSTGVANRIFMEHTHVESRRYSVFAHIRNKSATPSTSTIAAGSKIAQMGHNGSSSGPHLHLTYYRLNRFGRLRLLPMAFALRKDTSSEVLVGVPADDVRAIAATDVDPNDPLVVKLEVHVTTANEAGAGTDADITVTIAGRTFPLDNPGRNDFERNATDVFILTPWSGLRTSMLRGGIRIHKSPDGSPLDAWLLDGVKVVVNGTNLFVRQGLHTWLSNAPMTNRLDWSDTI
jgi:Peptidase family M23/PLAT/LH2 domain